MAAREKDTEKERENIVMHSENGWGRASYSKPSQMEERK